MKYYIFLALILIIAGCNKQSTNQIEITPDWELNDSRFILTNVQTFTTINSDTLVNVSGNRLSHFQIADKDKENFELIITPLDSTDFQINTTIDSMNHNFEYLEFLITELSKAQIPFNAIISKAGAVKGLLDWDLYHDNFLKKVYHLADSLNIKQEELQQVEHYFSSNNSEQSFKNGLLKELDDYFDLYGTIISKDSITTEIIQTENPNNGLPIEAKLTYRIISKINDTYKIGMKIDFGEELFSNEDEYLNEFFNGKSDSLNKPSQIFENFGVYYWNSKTTWIDSSSFEVNFINDSINVHMATSIQTYQ